MALFIDNIGAPDINFGSVCCIYQLLNAPKTKIYDLGSSSDFLKEKKDAASIKLSEGEATVYYSFQNKAPPIFGATKMTSHIFPAFFYLESGGIVISRGEWGLT